MKCREIDQSLNCKFKSNTYIFLLDVETLQLGHIFKKLEHRTNIFMFMNENKRYFFMG